MDGGRQSILMDYQCIIGQLFGFCDGFMVRNTNIAFTEVDSTTVIYSSVAIRKPLACADVSLHNRSMPNIENLSSWMLLAAVVAVGCVHFTGVGGAYVLDDESVTSDEALQDFFALGWVGGGNRAVVRGSFALQFAVLGDSAIASHFVNIAVHTFNTFLVFWVAAKAVAMCYRDWPNQKVHNVGLVTALLWGVHPLATAAVVYVVQRFESVAATFFLLSLGSYLHSRQLARRSIDAPTAMPGAIGLWLFLCILFGCLAYGSKEMTAGLAFVIFAAERTLVHRVTPSSILCRLTPWILMLPVLFGAWKLFPSLTRPDDRFGTAGYDLVGIDAIAYIVSQPVVYLKYLQLTFFPVGQVLDYGWLPLTDPIWLVAGTIGWIGLFGGCVYALRNRLTSGFALASILAILAPTSFIPLTDLVFEHRFYLPLAFVIGSVVVAIAQYADAPLVKHQQRWRFAVVGLACVLSVLTVARNLDYSTHLSLLRNDYARQPGNPRTVHNLSHFDENRSPPARLALLEKAIEMSEQREYFYPGTKYKWSRELADELYLLGQLDAAKSWYQRVLPESHDELQRAEIEWSLALIATLNNDWNEAEHWFASCLARNTKIRPQVVETYNHYLKRHVEESSATVSE